MQETRPEDLTPEEAQRQNKLRQEFFRGETFAKVQEKMNKRLDQLPRERLVRRVKIGRNDPCPCESGYKFKHCCIHRTR